ncbi:MAG TPA: carboxyl transferase domain-containing protein, partial [Flavilitoribacter sp.]|nr:carboxyl transferase domain-containing protein [Flavilitoribacter sp.]
MDSKALERARNVDSMKLLVSQMNRKLDVIKEGGGKKRLDKQRAQGKMTARERIDYLLDKDKPFLEIGAFAGYEMYPEEGGCPAAGVVAGLGYIRGRQCVVVANDA